MDEFLIDLLYEYKDSYFDFDAMNRIIEKYKEVYNMNEYISEVINKKRNWPENNAPAEYSYLNNKIFLYRKQLESIGKTQLKKINSIFFVNLNFIQFILHELEHAVQKKMILTESSEVALLLKLSIAMEEVIYAEKNKFLIWKHDKYYHDCDNRRKKIIDLYYNNQGSLYALQERMAQNNSYEHILRILGKIDLDTKIYEKFNGYYRSYKYWGYFHLDYEFTEVISPLVKYLKKLGYDNELRERNWYDDDIVKCLKLSQDNYSLEERIYLGLPATLDEIKAQYEKYKILKL